MCCYFPSKQALNSVNMPELTICRVKLHLECCACHPQNLTAAIALQSVSQWQLS